MRAFRVSERDLAGDLREVRLEGELDLSVAERFQRRLDAAVVDDVAVLVCLEECDFIDSTGIAVIVLAYQQLAKKGRRLFVCHPSPGVSRILELTGLTDQGIVYESADAALAEQFGRVASRPFRASPIAQGLSAPNGDPTLGSVERSASDSATTAPGGDRTATAAPVAQDPRGRQR